MRAIVYVRSSTPRVGFIEYGHVGWGFETQAGKFNIGSVENTNKAIQKRSLHLSGREIGDCVSSINLRRGRLRLFEHPHFEGHFLDFKGPYIVTDLRKYGFDNKISSFQAWR